MMDTDAAPVASIAELVKQYEDEVAYGEDRAAAEYAYAIALRSKDTKGGLDQAREYARRSLRHAGRLPSKTLDDVSSARLSVGGVPIPELFHDGVVRSRLADLLPD
ncbi:hypothetical protein [Actinoplanes regularis]|uniref:Uncharacterized protein n=1 Tax=Actinoplanes regularis TaxID=52697 RepID=A0A239BCC5_9ACTN|nr:hypothetical protein [Actinoplanes regularis]GIE87886.1 hypothetical protein Are01nite_43660 [Actinoplanes regularis]SNS05078.1 hypothetical protein SAMN06264365_10989 [Actinoplanes regularis]